MPLREKLRKTFTSKKNTDSNDSTPTGSPPKRKDIEYYKESELPKLKYRGRIDPEHKEKLENFSFVDAFQTARRKSSFLSGTFSPGGTHAQSRRGSWMSRSKSVASTAATSEADNMSVRRKSGAVTPGVRHQDTVTENEEDDTDVFNAGLSRAATQHASRQDSVSTPTTKAGSDDTTATATANASAPTLHLEKTVTDGNKPSPNDTPFTTEELEAAMTKATLKPYTEGLSDNRVSIAA